MKVAPAADAALSKKYAFVNFLHFDIAPPW
jgi:hypothetical protein